MALDATVSGENADSYVTLGEFETYADRMGFGLTASKDAREVALRRAAMYLDNTYIWAGIRTVDAQALGWPRDEVPDIDSKEIASGTIPEPVKNAQCEMAQIIIQGADPFATTTQGTVASIREKVDVIETQTVYSGSAGRAKYPAIDGLLRGYANGKVDSVASVGITRA